MYHTSSCRLELFKYTTHSATSESRCAYTSRAIDMRRQQASFSHLYWSAERILAEKIPNPTSSYFLALVHCAIIDSTYEYSSGKASPRSAVIRSSVCQLARVYSCCTVTLQTHIIRDLLSPEGSVHGRGRLAKLCLFLIRGRFLASRKFAHALTKIITPGMLRCFSTVVGLGSTDSMYFACCTRYGHDVEPAPRLS